MTSVLYFPYLQPPDSWLRLAALCWDRVHTLSSSNARAYDFVDDRLAGMIEPLDVSMIGRSPAVAGEYDRWLAANEDRLRDVVATSSPERDLLFGMFEGKYHGGEFVDNLIQRGLAKREGFQGEQKTLISELEQLPGEGRLAAVIRASKEGLLPSEPQVFVAREAALHYLSICAAALAKERRADLFADCEPFADTAIAANSEYGAVSVAIIEAYVPDALEDLSLDQLNDVRNEFSSARVRYQRAVRALCEEVASVSSDDELRAITRRIVEFAKERIEETRKTYRRARITAIGKALGASLTPASVTSVASLLGIGIFQPAAVVAAIALVGATYLAEREKAEAEKNNNAWCYVLNVSEAVKTRSVRQRDERRTPSA